MAAKHLQIKFNEWKFINNKLSLDVEDFLLEELRGKIPTNKNSGNKKPSFEAIYFPLKIKNASVNNSNFILESKGEPMHFQDLNANFKGVEMNEKTVQNAIPVQVQSFNISTKNFNYKTKFYDLDIGHFALNKTLVDLKNISVKPTAFSPQKAALNLAAKQLQIKINELKFVNNKVSLDVQNIAIDELKGKILPATNPQKKKANFGGIQFPLVIRNISLKNSDIIIESKGEPLDFHDVNANFQNIEMNANTVKNAFPAQIGFYSLSTRNFGYKTKFYNLSGSLFKMSKSKVQVSDFAMIPRVSRAQYIRMIPSEKDLYNLKFRELSMIGNWDLLSDKKYLNASELILDGVIADIFRSKIPKDDVTKKPMYSTLLRSIKIPVVIQNFNLKNSHLIYEEDTKISDGPGRLFFSNFHLNAKNINSGKMKGKATQVPIAINCKFMDVSPLTLNWNLDTASMNDAFTIKGNIKNLPAPSLNAFIQPYLKIRATGLISDLNFDFKGNLNGIEGAVRMKNEGLKISILKPGGENNVVLSTVANLAVKGNSGNYPASVRVLQVKRDATKSFFNLFWRGMEEGLKLTLIGEKVLKAGENVKEAVKNTKIMIKDGKKDIKEISKKTKSKINVIEKKANILKQNIKETKNKVKKEGAFKGIFKKKSEK